MLFMLMFLGLLPATLAHGSDDRDAGPAAGPAADGPDPAPEGGAEGAAPGDLLDLIGGAGGAADPLHADDLPGADADADADPGAEADDPDLIGEVVRIPADSGDVSISGFQPGIDRLELQLDAEETRFESITDPESGAPGLQISGPQGAGTPGEDDDRQILFPGLDALPVADILLTREDADGVAVFRLQGLVDAEPVLPSPTDGEEVVTPPADEDGAALSPLDPEAGESVTPGHAGEDGPPLTPLPGDAEEVVTPAAAELSPAAAAPRLDPDPADTDPHTSTGEPRAAA